MINSMRQLMRRLPNEGNVRHLLRSFNMAPHEKGKASSVKDLAVSLGFDVVQKPLPVRQAGRLEPDPFAETCYRIEVNEFHTVESRRFALLHELGHFYLHVDRSDPFAQPMFLDRSEEAFYLNPIEEREANDFAETVLFGDGALEAAIILHGKDMERLRRLFGMSERTIEIALRKLR